jgi:pimeloyl-ACP methyl ester carboxylesterase
VLLNGWQIGFTGTCPVATTSATTFGNLAQYLVSDGVPVVYLFDNCLEDPNQPIETLANDLGLFLNTIKYDDGTQVPQIDLVGHSMGGLIARAYLAGLQPNQTYTPPANTLVRKLVLIATPNFGSFVAFNNVNTIGAATQSAELVPGSAFLWNLATWNQHSDDLRGVDAIAIIGNAGSYSPDLSLSTVLANASDGLVSLTSASLGFVSQKASVTRIVPYCHVDPASFTNAAWGTFNHQ